MFARLSILVLFVASTLALPVVGQPVVERSALPELADSETLRTLVPERVGEFTFDQVSIPPFAAGKEDQESIALNALYRDDQETTLFIVIAHYRNSEAVDRQKRLLVDRVAVGEASDTSFASRRVFVEEEAARLTTFVGSTIELRTYLVGQASLDELFTALDLVDLKALEAIDRSYVRAYEHAVSAATDQGHAASEAMAPVGERTAAIAGVEGDVDCATFNDDLKAEVREMMGDVELVAWSHVLDEETAATAKRPDGQSVAVIDAETVVTFPKAGNAWLQCVRENDLLWAPLGAHSFLARVKEIWEQKERAAFRVVPAGFGDVLRRGRVELKGDSPD